MEFHLSNLPSVAAAIAAAQRAETLDQLYSEMQNFTGLETSHLQPFTAPQKSPYRNPIMIVSEKPEAEDRDTGIPYSGEYGQYMQKMAYDLEINLDSCHITYAVQWLPEADTSPNKTQISIARPFLFREIELVQPRAILVQGSGVIESLYRYGEGVLELYGSTMNIRHNGRMYEGFLTAHPKYAGLANGHYNDFVTHNREFFEANGSYAEGTLPGTYGDAAARYHKIMAMKLDRETRPIEETYARLRARQKAA